MWQRLKLADKVGLFFFTAFIISSLLFWVFEEHFDKDNWSSHPTKRYKMVDDLLEQKILNSKSVYEVIELLGMPNTAETLGNDVFVYQLGSAPSFSKPEKQQLLIIFEQQKVVRVAKTKTHK